MKAKITLASISILMGAAILITGCGSSSASNTSASNDLASGTAFYLDSAVEGVTVECAGHVSVSDSQGRFEFVEGQSCQFTIGNIVLRQQSNITQDQIIIEDNVRTAQFLQTLDFDGNPDNGISIHTHTAEVLQEHGLSHVPSTDQELAEVSTYMEQANMGYHGNFVPAHKAQEHFMKTKAAFEKKMDSEESETEHHAEEEGNHIPVPENNPTHH